MEQKSKSIGTTTYHVTQMDAISALKIQTKLAKILGASLFSLIGDKSNPEDKMGKVISKLMDNFDDEIATLIVLKLFEKGVFYDKDDVKRVVEFSSHFTGKALEMWKVVAFILEVNFGLGELLVSSLPTTEVEAETSDS